MTTEGTGPHDQNRGSGGYGQEGYGREGGAGYGESQGYDPGYGGAPPKPRNGLGTAALVLGIIGLIFSWTAVLGIILGIACIVMGAKGSGRVKRGVATNRGAAVAGIVLGILSLIIGLVFAVIFAVSGFFLFGSPAGQNALDCLQQQYNNGVAPEQAAQACAPQFQQPVQIPTPGQLPG